MAENLLVFLVCKRMNLFLECIFNFCEWLTKQLDPIADDVW